MAKILLVNPLTVPDEFDKSLKEAEAFAAPLGLAYLAAVLEKESYSVEIIDGQVLCAKKAYNYEQFKKYLGEKKPDVVGVTSTSAQLKNAIRTLDAVKEILPDSVTLIGGPHITALPDDLLKIKSADYGVYGEGEYTLLEVVERIANNRNMEDIPGVIYKHENKTNYVLRKFIGELDDLPLPARHLLPMELYKPSPANYRRLPAASLITSRGCPYNCAFCHKPIHGFKFRPHSVERVIQEIEQLISKYGVKDIQIYDDTFTLDRERASKICSEIINRKLNIKWNCMTRMDRVDLDLLKLMKKAGCYGVGYGIESGSERILKMIKKGITKQLARDAVKWAKKAGIEVRGFFILAYPTETEEEAMETINFAKELNVDLAQFMIVTPFPGTDLWRMCKEDGEIVTKDWSAFTFISPDSPPFIPSTMTKESVKNLYNKAYRSFYMRPSFILGQLKISSLGDIKRKFIATKAILKIG